MHRKVKPTWVRTGVDEGKDKWLVHTEAEETSWSCDSRVIHGSGKWGIVGPMPAIQKVGVMFEDDREHVFWDPCY